MPSLRQVGATASSMSRLNSDHSVSTAAIGTTAAARRIVRAEASDRPRWHQRARVDEDTELGGQHDLVAASRDRLADQPLVRAVGVHVRGVEQVDTAVERGADGGDGLGPVGGAVGVAHPHASQAKREQCRPAPADGAVDGAHHDVALHYVARISGLRSSNADGFGDRYRKHADIRRGGAVDVQVADSGRQPATSRSATTFVGRTRTSSSPGAPLRRPNSSARSAPM